MQKVVIAVSDEEKVLIHKDYEQLVNFLEGPKSKISIDDTDREQIRMAYELAVDAHSKQRRKSGEPYVMHPIAVAQICAEEIGLGATAIVCALLHDVVEDTDVTLKEVIDQFGPRAGKIVDGLTKLDGLYNKIDEQDTYIASPQAENFKKVLSTLVEDVRVVLIKMADRLHNMRTLGSMPRHKQLKIAAETSYIYSPLAHRLGLYKIKTEFEDLCMKITHTEAYQDIEAKLKATDQERITYVKNFIAPLQDSLKETGIDYRITGRSKSIYSIWNKIKTKKVAFEEIYDLFAIRIIVDVPKKKEKQVCWQVYSIVTDVHTPIPERLKDWVTTPKSNGYESLHTTVIGPGGRYVEVQIRSERMDEIAECGYAAHWKYKGVSNQQNVYSIWLDSVREILDNEDSDAIEFLNDFKTNLFKEEVYVYTPKGDLKILPKGATALDFAFSIHTDIGYHCTAIKVNNKLVPMGYKLQNGDQLHITTNKNQKPTENWLKMVVTGRARSKIRSAMREEKRRQGITGKEAIERKFQHLKIDFEENVEILAKYYRLKSRIDLYFEIAKERISLSDLKNIFTVEGGKLVRIPEEEPAVEPQTIQEVKPRKKKNIKGRPQLLIAGEPGDSYNYSLATCCNPVLGDGIFAYLTATAGLKIHRTSCPNATHMMANYGYRIMKAEWASTTNTSFIANLLITGVDDGPGVIERLSNNISTKLGLNIRSFYIDGNEGYFEGRVSLLVANKDQLNLAIINLKKLDGISNVVRLED